MRASNAGLGRWTVAIWMLAASAAAQNPELGDIGASADLEAEASTEEESSASGSWTSTDALGSTGDDEEDAIDDGLGATSGSDHDAVVGRLGIGFFGILDIPVMTCGPAAPGNCATPEIDSVVAPTIGARYWLDAGFGVELAVGFNLTSPESQTDVSSGGMTTRTLRTNEPSVLALGLHGGIPLVFAHSGHFVFEVVPELNFGFTSGTQDIVAAGTTVEWDVSGMVLEAGARAGAEIHFGFIDIPQLSLQATVGLALRVESRNAENTSMAGATTTHEQSRTRIATGLDGAPWDIFTGALTAIYYL